MTIPSYTWNKPQDGRKKDPINLVFVNTNLEKILEQLDMNDWSLRDDVLDFASTQYTPDIPPRFPQDDQRLNGTFWKRYHVRIWRRPKNSFVGSVHNEKFTLVRGHDPFNFESGKDLVEKNFDDERWEIRKDKHNLKNYNPEKYSNGKATEFKER